MAAETYSIDLAQSKVRWTGRKPTGAHRGSFPIKSGSLQMDGEKVVELKLLLDIRELAIEDAMPAAWKQKLIDHLKSEDFFHTDRFPSASYVLISSKSLGDGRLSASGRLTVKDRIRDLTAQIRLRKSADDLTLESRFTLDRTRWNLTYMAEKKLDPRKALDSFIYNDVEVTGLIIAHKEK